MIHETIKKNGITFGIITGLTSVLITTLIYSIDLNLFTSSWIGFGNLALYLIIAIVLLTKTKKEFPGLFTFKDAFTTYFVYAVIGILISVSFNVILFNFIDPGAKETLKEISIEAAVSMMKKFNTPAEAMKKAVEDMSNTDQFGIVEQFKGSIFTIIFSAIFAVILAAIFKSKPKEQF